MCGDSFPADGRFPGGMHGLEHCFPGSLMGPGRGPRNQAGGFFGAGFAADTGLLPGLGVGGEGGSGCAMERLTSQVNLDTTIFKSGRMLWQLGHRRLG